MEWSSGRRLPRPFGRRRGVRCRLLLARRPWIYWLVVIALGAAVAVAVEVRLSAVDRARSEWGDTVTVWVADADIEPGEPVRASRAERPVVGVPAHSLSGDDTLGSARQHIRHGEIIVDVDVTRASGPAASADPGEIVVAVSDPVLGGSDGSVSVGTRVAVYAEGIVLADRARIVQVGDDVVFVATRAGDAPAVAAASQMRIATLAFVP